MKNKDVLTAADVINGFDFKVFPAFRGKTRDEVIAALIKYEGNQK
jgi:hypothetical protein